jgi:hypothetical protein
VRPRDSRHSDAGGLCAECAPWDQWWRGDVRRRCCSGAAWLRWPRRSLAAKLGRMSRPVMPRRNNATRVQPVHHSCVHYEHKLAGQATSSLAAKATQASPPRCPHPGSRPAHPRRSRTGQRNEGENGTRSSLGSFASRPSARRHPVWVRVALRWRGQSRATRVREAEFGTVWRGAHLACGQAV